MNVNNMANYIATSIRMSVEKGIEQTPGFKFMLALREALETRGITRELANEITTSMEITINHELSDDALNNLVSAYADAIKEMKAIFHKHDFGRENLINYVKKMSVTIS